MDAFQFAFSASDDDDTADAVAQPIDAAPPTGSAAAAGADDPQMCKMCLIAQRSNVALVPCGHARFCGNCANSRVYGQRLPDMPQSYQDGAAPVQLNFWTIVASRGSVKTNSTCVQFLTMHTRTFFKHTDYACSAAYEQLSFSLYLQCYCTCIHFFVIVQLNDF